MKHNQGMLSYKLRWKTIRKILLFLIIIVLFSAVRDVFIEHDCEQRARKITGMNGYKQVIVGEALKNRYPTIIAEVSSHGKMQWLLKEELLCEANTKIFFKPHDWPIL